MVVVTIVVMMMMVMLIRVLRALRRSIHVGNGLKRRRDRLILLILIIAVIVEHVIGIIISIIIIITIITRHGLFEYERSFRDYAFRFIITTGFVRSIGRLLVLICLSRVDHRHTIISVVTVTARAISSIVGTVIVIISSSIIGWIIFGIFRIN